MQVTSVDLHRLFHSLCAGVIEDVRVQRDKGFGFVRYSTHAEAARAIQLGNARILFGKPVKVLIPQLYHCRLRADNQSFIFYKRCIIFLVIMNMRFVALQCSWGSKPTMPGTSSAPLPPPAAHMPDISATNLAAYEMQLALSKMGAAQALMHPQGQRIGAASHQAMYDGSYPGIATTQPPMYYQ